MKGFAMFPGLCVLLCIVGLALVVAACVSRRPPDDPDQVDWSQHVLGE